MYNPDPFYCKDPVIIEYLLRRYNFATLITNKGNGQNISHLPFYLDAKAGVLQGHIARANPQWKDFDSDRPVTVVFQGPHSYVSPRWYLPDVANVPTWNYAVVHIRGIGRIIEEEEKAFSTLKKLVAEHDPDYQIPDDGRMMLGDIVVFEIEVADIEAKLKLSQNRGPEDFMSVVGHLMKSQEQSHRETGGLMQLILERQQE